jgi:hypothetical protein
LRLLRLRALGSTLTIASCCLAAAPQLAQAGFGPPAGPTTPPFWQCPAVGKSTSCSFLIDVTGSASNPTVRVFGDPSQEFYDAGHDDEIVAVQNDTNGPLAKLHIGVANSGDNLFGFEGDGLCNPGIGATPTGCPFGGSSNTSDPFDYQGPDMSFEPGYSSDDGTVDFNPPLQPGQYTFFALDAPFDPSQVEVPVNTNDYITTGLSEVGNSSNTGVQAMRSAPGDFTDLGTLNGPNASSATGTFSYKVYSDPSCAQPVGSGGTKTIGTPSDPVGAALPTNAVYYWQATYTPGSGDPNNAVTSTCGTETMTFGTPPSRPSTGVLTNLNIGRGTPSPRFAVALGTAASDRATITGPSAGSATGTVTYAVYSDSACSQQVNAFPLHGDIRRVSGGAAGPSAAVTLPVGTYYFQATYSGDATHAAAQTPCGSEFLVVAKPVVSVPKPTTAQNGTIVNRVTTNLGGTFTVAGQISNAAAVLSRARKCGKGKIRVHGRCVSTRFGFASKSGTVAGTYVIKLVPSRAARRALAAGHTLHVIETVAYVPTGATRPIVKMFRVTVKPPRHKKRRH